LLQKTPIQLDQPKWAVENIHKHFKLTGEPKKEGILTVGTCLCSGLWQKDIIFKGSCIFDHIENKKKEKDKEELKGRNFLFFTIVGWILPQEMNKQTCGVFFFPKSETETERSCLGPDGLSWAFFGLYWASIDSE